MIADSPHPLVALDRALLLLMLAALAAVLTGALVLQLAFGEIPCPLCLLQRVVMLGVCFGLVRQLHALGSGSGSERGGGLALLCAVLLLVISARQTLLDIVPRPGHAYVGTAVLGLHMPVWSVVIAVALILGFAVRLAVFGGARSASGRPRGRPARLTRWLELYVLLLCALNFVAVVAQCGVGECHTDGYRLL
ncbi:MAG: disulfide bond formation protein B [Reyranellaceae bacterium]